MEQRKKTDDSHINEINDNSLQENRWAEWNH